MTVSEIFIATLPLKAIVNELDFLRKTVYLTKLQK